MRGALVLLRGRRGIPSALFLLMGGCLLGFPYSLLVCGKTWTILRSKGLCTTTSITVGSMARHLSGQEEKLVEVKVDVDSLPAGQRCCSRCAVASASVMGLLALALAAFFLYFFILMPSCNQQTTPLSGTEKVNMVFRLRNGTDRGSYDIFTADKTGTYLIYGWVRLSGARGEEVILKQVFNKDQGRLQKKEVEEGDKEIFFYQRVQLVAGTRIIISFKSECIDNLFHVYKL